MFKEEYKITEITGNLATIHSNRKLEPGSKAAIELPNIELEFTVQECVGYDKLYIITATINSGVEKIKESLNACRFNIPHIQSLYQAYQKTAEAAILNLSRDNVRKQKEIEMYASMLAVTNYLNKHVSDVHKIYDTICDMLIGITGATYVSFYRQSRAGLLMLKYSNSSNVGHHTMIKDYNKLVLNGCSIDDLTMEEAFITSSKPLDKNKNVRSLLGVPVKEQHLNDYIIVEHHDITGFNESHVKYLNILSAQLTSFFEARELYMVLREHANKDGLTGLFKREYLMTKLQESVANGDYNYAICMIDIDDFKVCNDTYGHQYGDEILKAIAEIYKNNTRKTDIVARFGGEEIICCFLNVMDKNAMVARVESMRKMIENIKIQDVNYSPTVSTGVSFGNKNKTIETVIKLADDALYQAKHTGKNRVVCSVDSSVLVSQE
ncbi:sensor domain-containing diguanylate cyclase [Clostridium tertium]|uniref:sensor domain-containing diguanylate cyclase n=1 Tax=Clostridium tertium TaxID=1559 RepID=UPI0023B2EC8F|nr:sensor domain-containing diguanylate cyclase [Clostridium tertium]